MPQVSERPAVEKKDFVIAVLVMIVMVVSSNILVQYPVEFGGLDQVLTWGAFTYPFVFLVSDLSNRRFGPAYTRRVAYVGFIAGVLISVYLSTPRIALASGMAFLCSQLTDITIFARMNQKVWWMPPFVSSFIASAIDTVVFFFLAFYCGALPFVGIDISGIFASFGVADTCESLPWATLALGDYSVKVAMALLALGPYGYLLSKIIPTALSPAFRRG